MSTTYHNIEEIIQALELIIRKAEAEESPMGYFAALYQKVTIKVKQGIEKGFFEDGARMEKLDILFAQRYLDAYACREQNIPPTRSWQIVFETCGQYWPIVLQHLLMGMNAHINLDLGIAAAEVSKGQNIDDLQTDFNRINEILSGLVAEVQNDLADIWPTLYKILRATRNVDDFMVDFSMEFARNGAWKFARALAQTPVSDKKAFIEQRDQKVLKKAQLVAHPGKWISFLFAFIRLGEQGSVAEKIKRLKQ